MSELAVGIDLGTSNTVIAAVKDNRAVVLPNHEGRRVHPSVVSFHPNGKILVGDQAKRRRVIDPANTINSAKRLIGRTFDSPAAQEIISRMAYTVERGDNEQLMIITRDNQLSVPEIAALILRYVRALSTKVLDVPIEHAVITVPANFNDAQREATRSAGRIAGLNVLRILNEPTAAALAYGLGRGMNCRIAIYDFGGGTFDVTLLELNDRVFEVLSTAGDTFLGGDDIDERIVSKMVEEFLRAYHVELIHNAGAMARLRSVAERTKVQLSAHPEATVQVQEIAYGEGGEPLDLDFKLTVDELDALTMDVVQRTFPICDEALQLAGLSATQIDEVVMVGGMTRMPLVRRLVSEYFNLEPRIEINPDEVVAVGAAIQAASLLKKDGGVSAAGSVLLDVTPRALGIAVVGGYAETIIDRNCQIPVEQTRVFATSRDEQTKVSLRVCQGESTSFDENELLGELVLDDLRPAPRGQVKIEVTFEIDTNGILQVWASDLDTGKKQQAHINVLGTMAEDDVDRLMRKQDELPQQTDF